MAWRAAGLGTGYASVAVAQGRVFTLGKRGADVYVSALSEGDGSLLWTTRIGSTSRAPASTPTVDGDRVYALDPDGELVCLRAAAGEIVWRRHLMRELGGRLQSGRGYGESPLVDGDRLICTPGGVSTMLVALNKLDGRLIWKTGLPELGSAGRDGAGFASVVVTQAAGRRQYVQLGGRGLFGVDASDGRFLWGYNGIANGTANIPTPIARGDLVFSANGYNAGSVLLRLAPGGPTGVEAREVYSLSGSRFQNHHGGVILVGDHLYGGHGSNNGLPTCLDLQTGSVVWKERGAGVGSAAVVRAGDRFCFRYQNGVVAWVQATPGGYAVHGTLQVPGAGGDSWAHPVVANGRLLLREQDALWAYHLRPDRGALAVKVGGKSPRGSLRRTSSARRPVPVPGLSLQADPSPKGPWKSALYHQAVEGDTIPWVTVSPHQVTASGALAPAVADWLTSWRRDFGVRASGTRLGSAGLAQCARMPGLVALELDLCTGVTDDGLASLARASRLRALSLAGTGVTELGLVRLAALPRLRGLDLEGCEGITDQACEVLGGFRVLRVLLLRKTGFERQRITDAGLRKLEGLNELECLDLYGNQVSDSGLPALSGLQALRHLDLSLTAITDSGLPHLRTLSRLQRLDLLYSEGFAGPRVTDQGLDALLALTTLRTLDLTGARISDAGAAKLAGLRQLAEVRLTRTNVTDAGATALRAARPGCAVTL
jgi:outer membrane protein assembly factor BamB